MRQNRFLKFLASAKAWSVLLALAGAMFCVDVFMFGVLCKEYSQSALSKPDAKWPPPKPREAIVVLTGDGYRIPSALRLLRSRNSPMLIISGAGRGVTLTDLINQQGASDQIHETWERIVMESRSESTVENALETAKLVHQYNISEIILVTSDYHMPRASLIFQEAMPKLEQRKYPVISSFTRFPSLSDTRSWTGFWKFLVEYAKYFLYAMHLLPHP